MDDFVWRCIGGAYAGTKKSEKVEGGFCVLLRVEDFTKVLGGCANFSSQKAISLRA
jgi:hypothetical protein